MRTTNIYKDRGFADRKAYLDDLAVEYSVDNQTVYVLADMLGPSEDFDGLINALEDMMYDVL